MRLLVVEDDPTISRFLVKGLREDQHLVDLAEDGDAAEARALAGDYDAILLDVMLPAQDGFTVCRRLRAQGVDTPILMVTARDTVGDRVHGLDTGADDYLVKPFAFDEVVARLRAWPRRGRTRSLSALLTAGPLSLDLEAHQARVTGTPVPLTATEYRLLEYLMRRAGRVVTRQALIAGVWGPGRDVEDNTLDAFVKLLRQKVDGAGRPPLIHTIRGVGYKIRSER